MESWQLEFTKKNLVQLVEITHCNISLLTILQQHGILSSEEVELIRKTPGRESAYNLYRILKTRVNSFAILKDALLQTCQTGAYQLLLQSDIVQEKNEKYNVLHYDHNGTPIRGNAITLHKGEFGTRMALIKIYRNHNVSIMKQAENELGLLTIIDWHENIQRLYVAKYVPCEFSQHFAIAMDFQINLVSFLKENNINQNSAVSLVNQAINGVEFLHNNGILHLNIKPKSIFVQQKPWHNEDVQSYIKLKIGQFGDARRMRTSEKFVMIRIETLEGTGSFETPEVLRKVEQLSSTAMMRDNNCIVGFKTDIFCLSNICYFILSGGNYAFGNESYRRQVNIIDNRSIFNNQRLSRGIRRTQRNIFRLMFSSSMTQRPEIEMLRVAINDPANSTFYTRNNCVTF